MRCRSFDGCLFPSHEKETSIFQKLKLRDSKEEILKGLFNKDLENNIFKNLESRFLKIKAEERKKFMRYVALIRKKQTRS